MEILGIKFLLTAILGVLIWKFVLFLIRYRRWCLAAAKFHVIGPIHPIWGNLHLFKHGYEWFFFAKKVVSHDRAKIIITWVTSLFPSFGLVHPEVAKAILKAPAIPKPVRAGSSYGLFIAWLGYGLLFSSGAKWQRNRKMFNPAFSIDKLRPYVDTYNKVADTFIDKLESLSKADISVEITKLTALATLDTLFRCIFSYETDVQRQGDDHPYVQAVDQLTKLAADRFINPVHLWDALYAFTTPGKKFFRHCNYVHEFASKITKKRREELTNHPSSTERRRLDLLDMLLLARDTNGEGLSDREIRDEVDTFMFAGHDTTASALNWTLFCLGKYPEYQEKVYAELKDIMQDKNTVTWGDFPKMRLLMLFIKESMRMYTPVPLISRTLDEPLDIGGVTLPNSIDLLIAIDCINHNPDVWPDHDQFKLYRFDDQSLSDMDPFSYIPFSAGPRNCIGQNFALNELRVFLTKILIKFQVILDTDHEVIPIQEVVMKAKNGIKIKFLPR